MKLLKKLFLFMATSPFVSAFFTVFVPGIFLVIYFNFYCQSSGKDVTYYQQNCAFGLIIGFIIFAVLALINFKVIGPRITMADVKENELVLIIYPAPGNEIKIYKKPLWGRYLKTVIRFPANWVAEVKKGDENYYHTGINIIIKSDVRLFISLTFNFIFSGPFKAEDLYFKFMDGRILDEVDVDKFIVEDISNLNLSGETYAEMIEYAKSYYCGKMTKNQLITCILGTIKAPKLFFNVATIGLTVKKVKFNNSTLIEE